LCAELIQNRIQWWVFEDGSEIFVPTVGELFDLQNKFLYSRDPELRIQWVSYF